MTQTQKNGFREIAHTADLEIMAWGEDLPDLFWQAARGMYYLMGVQLARETEKPSPQTFHVEGIDHESLLVTFLDELLYILEEEQLAFTALRLEITENTLHCQGHGIPVIAQERGIKAVTYHNLKIQSIENRLTVRIVFDV